MVPIYLIRQIVREMFLFSGGLWQISLSIEKIVREMFLFSGGLWQISLPIEKRH